MLFEAERGCYQKNQIDLLFFLVVRARGSYYVDLLAVAEKLLLLMLFKVVLVV